jgi:hypothetical protein
VRAVRGETIVSNKQQLSCIICSHRSNKGAHVAASFVGSDQDAIVSGHCVHFGLILVSDSTVVHKGGSCSAFFCTVIQYSSQKHPNQGDDEESFWILTGSCVALTKVHRAVAMTLLRPPALQTAIVVALLGSASARTKPSKESSIRGTMMASLVADAVERRLLTPLSTT